MLEAGFGAPTRASCPCPLLEERHGEGWQGSDGCRRRLLREVQGEAEDLQRAAGEDGERSPGLEGRVPGLWNGDVQDPAAVEVSRRHHEGIQPPAERPGVFV